MRFIPSEGRLLVKRNESSKQTPGGLYVPPSVQQTPTTGKLLACSGDSPYAGYLSRDIVFGKYAGTEITVDNEEFLVVKEEDLIGVLLPD